MRAALLPCALLAAACAADPGPGEGDATLRFGVTNGVRANPTLEDPLVGTIYGNLFLASDVTLLGPKDGAVEHGYVELTGVDLEAATQSAAWQTPPLAPGTYVFLGFFDVDGNGAETRDPDPGDPVTLPGSNELTIVAGETVTLDAVFDLVLN